MAQIINLSDVAARQVSGGKAYSLGQMLRAGIAVPDGFVVSADSYMSLNPALKDAILQSFDELDAEFVAVRSSAVNEDGMDASWAGQLDTYLNCSRDDLFEKIQACWNSVRSKRALAYAKQKAAAKSNVAVIVQKMVNSDVSGVAFSVHPVTQNVEQMVIEAALGLGEAVVSGQITPDTYIVDKQTGLPIQKHIVRQARMLVSEPAGSTGWKELDVAGNRQKLSDKLIREIASQTKKLEMLFGYPVDVEWATQKDLLYILQSRPITALNQ